MRLKKLVNENYLLFKAYNNIKKLYYRSLTNEKMSISKIFEKRLGRSLNLDNPIYYNDKLQWLKINWRDELATKCVDKFGVRAIVQERIGGQYLNELYAVYENVNDIDISVLPDSFVLKGTHGSGFNIVCKDKSEMNWRNELNKMKRWLSIDYHLKNREWVYKDVKPRIICEKYIEQDDGDELRDYRFFCFNGKPKFIAVDFSITNKQKTRRNIYDLNWNMMDCEISYPKELSMQVPKPKLLKEMISLSEKISSGFPHARVDFYYIKEKIIFGEITFFHQSGMGKIKPQRFEEEMGRWLKLMKE